MEPQTKTWITIEIVATITLILGVALTSWNIYPENIYMSILGNFLWLILALNWKRWSLITIQTFVLLLYTGGIIKYLTGV